ncbi:toxin-activating lysine-acyltransferase [Morganella morganii]|uniref:toxin-activating lysine-acyltransferase n=1 Tax=Morganella morganii TaxID=582 RepID=UPI00055C0C43|nr:toxin-activating lysine-acyltransferase [Morganella morganii]MDS0909236.1 toxin-activating lysine-acyltransferase [Morganella morganii]HCU2394270.1 toxin-activating lysine-acyltransferase [Morganella morganii]HED1573590.1 toxin-activating lysine-acyltransferase [Morganella morganii]HEI8439280.1 toxin-activating lysine-acyltransferase [Morganella morganii]
MLKDIKNLRLIAPSLFPENSWSEAEVFGAMVWLWNKHSKYKLTAIDVASESLLAIIRSNNFALVVIDNKPIGYINWAYMNDNESNDYINNRMTYIEAVGKIEKSESKKTWVLSWFVPESTNYNKSVAKNNLLIKRIAKEVIFSEEIVYVIWHHHKKRNIVKKFKGLSVNKI